MSGWSADHRRYSCVCGWTVLIVDVDHRWYSCVCVVRVDCWCWPQMVLLCVWWESWLLMLTTDGSVVCATSRTQSTQRAVCWKSFYSKSSTGNSRWDTQDIGIQEAADKQYVRLKRNAMWDTGNSRLDAVKGACETYRKWHVRHKKKARHTKNNSETYRKQVRRKVRHTETASETYRKQVRHTENSRWDIQETWDSKQQVRCTGKSRWDIQETGETQ